MISSTGMQYRDNMRQKLVDILRQAYAEILESKNLPDLLEFEISDKWPLECAIRIEELLYKTLKSGKPYVDKSRSILFNLQDTKNSTLRQKLIFKEISPEEFLQVDVRKFASEDVKNQRIAAEKTNMYNKRTDWDNEEVKA